MLSEGLRTVVLVMEQQPAVVLGAELTRVLDDVGEVPLLSLSAAELGSSIESYLSLIDRLSAQLARLIERAEEVDLPADLGAPSTAVWLRARFGLSPRSAAALVRQASGLRAAPVAARAARLGAVRVEAAAEIGHALAALPAEVGPELRAGGADVLLGLAVGRDGPPLDAHQLRRVGEHLHEVLEPELAEQLLAARLDREDAGANRRRYLSIVDDHDGGVRLRGLLTIEAGAILRAVLDPLAAPRPAAPGKDEQSDSPSGDTAAGGTASGRTASEADGLVTDDRTGGQRLADALVEVADRALAQGDLPASGGQRPTLVLTMDHGQLAAGLGAGTLPDGNQLSPPVVRRIACDAAIVTAILGTRGQVLYLGRAARTASPAQRRALALRDRGCAFPGCDRPPAWCDAHHIQHWDRLGRTDLDNLVLVCGHHHRVLHRDGWSIRPPTDGIRPLFVPPAWVDPLRRGRRNLQHHVDDLLAQQV